MRGLKKKAASASGEGDVKFVGIHSHEEPDQLVTAAEVAEDKAIHTSLDPAVYGDDGLWNQQLFVASLGIPP